MVLTKTETNSFTRADQRIILQDAEQERQGKLDRLKKLGISPEEIAIHSVRKLSSGRRALEVPTKPVGAPGEVHPAPLRSAHADTDAAWLTQSEK